MRIPLATYRLQFGPALGFDEAAELADYLADLGVDTLYASPIFAARPGSAHGYDVIDPGAVNPELGGEEGFARLSAALARRGMGLLLDVVPNHMCVAAAQNAWWSDVLENGPSSPHARWFDIDWSPPKADLANKVLLPVLGDQYGRVLENGEIRVGMADGGFHVDYHGLRLPTAPRTTSRILAPVLERIRPALGPEDPYVLELESIVTALSHLPSRTETDPERVRERQREKEIVKRRLAALVDASPAVARALEAVIVELNGKKGDPRSFDGLEAFLASQAYRLSSWRVAADEINYRRFFDINDLAAIRVEEPAVFAAVHGLAFRLLAEGRASGFRIDHVDGLFAPGAYLAALQARAAELTGGPAYVVVEKILEPGEVLRRDWPVAGTTGYEFLNLVNGVFMDGAAAEPLRVAYARFTGEAPEFESLLYGCKRLILRISMAAELHVLARRLDRISEQHRFSRDFTLQTLQDALREVIACFPVYRTYVGDGGAETVDPQDRAVIARAIGGAKRRNPLVSESVYDFLESVLLLEHPDGLDEGQRAERLEFVMRFQQLTGPVMAKALEDTAFYRFYPLASLCEVGGSPAAFGTSLADFHRCNAERLASFPHGLSATSTHDTKRSEDVRVRLDALSEIPDDWARAIERWREWNGPKKRAVGGRAAPDANEEYLYYQTLVGVFPPEPPPPEERRALAARVAAYMEKALREAKVHTSWSIPNEAYERAVRAFIEATLEPGRFLEDLVAFVGPIARAGALASLAQVVLKIASPGVPDFYQGTEVLELSLVDPDNRRPVDFATRRRMLEELDRAAERDPVALAAELAARPEDGRAKLYVTSRGLRFRRRHLQALGRGAYRPIAAQGPRARHIVAFARGAEPKTVVALAARFFLRLGAAQAPLGPAAWGETMIELEPGRWRDGLTGLEMEAGAGGLQAAEAFHVLPVALLERVSG